MTKSFKKIDRGTLLRGSGATALVSLLAAAAAEARATPAPGGTRCCDPGDYWFESGTKKKSKSFLTVKGVRLMGAKAGGPPPPTPTGWTPKYFVPAASGHGFNGHGVPNKVANVDIYIFVK